jgi:hypothetical protein
MSEIDSLSASHFRAEHERDKWEWTDDVFGDEMQRMRSEGISISDIAEAMPEYLGYQDVYRIAKEYPGANEFECPIVGCDMFLTKLQERHFHGEHGLDPIVWLNQTHGLLIERLWETGFGAYTIADHLPEYVNRTGVGKIFDRRDLHRTQSDSISGENSPMKRPEVREQFKGENNPAKQDGVGEKISEAISGEDHWLYDCDPEEHPMTGRENPHDEETKEIISQKVSESAPTGEDHWTHNDPESKEKLGRGRRGKKPPVGSGWLSDRFSPLNRYIYMLNRRSVVV